jgi:hypothetical protein
MTPPIQISSLSHALLALLLGSTLALGCAPSMPGDKIPPAPVLTLWPDPTYLPERQCHGDYRVEDLNRYLPRARLAMWLPSTRSVTLDEHRRCLVVKVESYGTGRLAELLLRGVAVPRRAVLLVVG